MKDRMYFVATLALSGLTAGIATESLTAGYSVAFGLFAIAFAFSASVKESRP